MPTLRQWFWQSFKYLNPEISNVNEDLRQEELDQERNDEIRAEHGGFEPMSPKDLEE